MDNLYDFEDLVQKSVDDAKTQQTYVKSLADKIQNGAVEISIYTNDNVWTKVNLQKFWKLQNDRLASMSAYSGELVALLTNLRATLEESLSKIKTPEERELDAHV